MANSTIIRKGQTMPTKNEKTQNPNQPDKNTITVTDNRTGKSYQFPILSGSVGPDVVDIRQFYKATDMFTFDPGFTSTASCESNITFIDGDKGILMHRGYKIEDLANKASFLEVAYLLIYGELPSQNQYEEFVWEINHHSLLHEQILNFYRGFRRDAHPMATLVGVVGALSAFYEEDTKIADPEIRERAMIRIIAKMPTLVATSYKYSVGQPFVYPQNNLSYAGNFLRMCFSVPCEEYIINPVLADALDKIFILHADHEQNASTSTVRLAGSSKANPYACMSAGISCLWGPSHGGANEAVLKMLSEIGNKKNITEFLNKVKTKNDDTRLMGFGHRVYKNYDPRASVLKKSCDDVLNSLKIDDPLLELAKELETIALQDDYFISRKLFPNVDFYSGIILKALGFPVSMFTALFALARMAGWVAQWNEMMAEKDQKIGRPRQLYNGQNMRDFIPINKRNG